MSYQHSFLTSFQGEFPIFEEKDEKQTNEVEKRLSPNEETIETPSVTKEQRRKSG